MTLIPYPRDCLAGITWEQEDARPVLQKSAWTGKTREFALGPAARWRASGSVVPMWDDAQRLLWTGFEAAAQVPGTRFQLPAVERSQYGAADNLIANPTLVGNASGWVPTNVITRAALPDSADATGFAPFDIGFFHQSSFGAGGAVANGGNTVAIGSSVVYASAWSLFGSGSTGNNSLRLEWRDIGGSVISTSVLSMDPGALPANTWHFFSGSYTPPGGAVSVRIFFLSAITAGSALFGLPRVSTFPAACTAATGSVGRSLNLAGLALSRQHLARGQLLTVTLPSGDQQLARLTAPLVSNGSGTATAALATPLREVPANGAAVQLAEPWGLMRAVHSPGWGVGSDNTYRHGFEAEEAF